MRSRCLRQGLGGVKVKVEVKVTVKVKVKATGAIDFGRAELPGIIAEGHSGISKHALLRGDPEEV